MLFTTTQIQFKVWLNQIWLPYTNCLKNTLYHKNMVIVEVTWN